MRKEIVIAIFAGLIIGLVVAFGAWRFNSTVKEDTKNPVAINTSEKTEGSAALVASDHSEITLSSAEDFDVIANSPFSITGIASPQSKLFISAENKDYILSTSEDGSFSQEIDLISGINQVLFASIDKDGKTQTKKLVLIYSSDFAEIVGDYEAVNNSTESANSVLDKVRQKVESIRKNPKAILGSVTNKTADTMQVQNINGKIELMSIGEDIKVTRVGKTSTNIKFSDVAIGDFVVGLGFSSGNGVLDAKKILITDPLTDPTRQIKFATISQIARKEITTTTQNGENFKLSLPSRWTGPDTKDMEIDMFVGIVSEANDEKTELRTIEIITSEQNGE